MMLWPPEVTLARDGVRLEPLTLAHEAGIRAAATDGQLWNLRVTSVPAPGEERTYIETAQKTRRAFAVIDEVTGRVMGSTSYHDTMEAVKRVEIGFTWYAKSAQRSHVNTTCKLLLMAHAFDTLHCNVVGWRTDLFNFDSQRAIERLGARRDGTIRQHALRRDGTVRDTVMYSMTPDEWPEKRGRLEARLKKHHANAQKIPTAQPSVTVCEITPDNLIEFLELSPGALGERMVARNSFTVAQALLGKKASNAVLRGVLADGKPVGLFMLCDPTRGRREGTAEDELYIWRFMVDLHFQRKGVGRQMMQEIIRMASTMPAIRFITLSYAMREGSPKPFYEKFGFRETGNIDDGEMEMKVSIEEATKHL
jgi:RimJ/RimL family protein N-acetyltransferase